MRYHLLVMGQLKRGFVADGCKHYQRRLESYGKLNIREFKEQGRDRLERQQRSAQSLLQASQGHVIALDETGTAWSSQGLADELNRLELSGVSQLSILIGGAAGLGEAVQQAHGCWSLSRLTFPHELARLIVLEQLYRAETIRTGHPYHRD